MAKQHSTPRIALAASILVLCYGTSFLLVWFIAQALDIDAVGRIVILGFFYNCCVNHKIPNIPR